MKSGPFIFYIVGVALYCAMDAVMKQLVMGNTATLATFWRYLAAILFTGAVWWMDGRPRLTLEMARVHGLRGVVLAITGVTFFWSLTVLKLAEAVTFAFIAPLLVPPIAAVLLKEKLRADSVIAGVVGFGGVLLAVGLDHAAFTSEKMLGVLAVLVSASSYAVNIVMMRMRAAKDGPALLSLSGALFPAIVLLPFVLIFHPPQAVVPQGADIGLALFAGLLGAMALQLFARAYAQAEAQMLAPFEYTALVWAALMGWAFFNEPVSASTLAGAVVVAGACLWQARRASKIN